MSSSSMGGSFLPDSNQTITGLWTYSQLPVYAGLGTQVTTTATQTLTGKTLTSPILNGSVGALATEVVTATNVIAAAESGTTFFLNAATEFVSTLPAPAAGLNFRFIVSAAPSGASYTVVTTSSSNIIIGQQHDTGGAAGDFGNE